MGKNLIQQRKGRGTARFRSPGHRFDGEVRGLAYGNGGMRGEVVDLIHSPAHHAPVAVLKISQFENTKVLAPEGMKVGDVVFAGNDVELISGNCTALKNIPEGTAIHNIEGQPGDGGKFVRSSGGFARVKAHMGKNVLIILPSKKEKFFDQECRAFIGVLAGSGRKEKPFIKAGRMVYAKAARNRYYPRSHGTSMNAVAHPYGCSRSSRKGMPTIAARNAPPGKKVGKIRPRRTGMRR